MWCVCGGWVQKKTPTIIFQRLFYSSIHHAPSVLITLRVYCLLNCYWCGYWLDHGHNPLLSAPAAHTCRFCRSPSGPSNQIITVSLQQVMSAHFSNLCDQFRYLQHEVNDIEIPPPPPKYQSQQLPHHPSGGYSNTVPSWHSSKRYTTQAGRIDTQELLRNMDVHNPHGCSQYGGSLPLMTYAQVGWVGNWLETWMNDMLMAHSCVYLWLVEVTVVVLMSLV